MNEIINAQLENHILKLTLNRPKAGNALSLDMLTQLSDKFEKIAMDSACKVVQIRANGHIFCAGHDLKEMTAARGKEDGGKAFSETMMACAKLMQQIVHCPKAPVIAVVQGTATAAEQRLLRAVILRLHRKRPPATPGVHIGLFALPLWSLLAEYQQKTGDANAAYWRGHPCRDSREMGPNQCRYAENLYQTADEWSEIIAQKPASTVRMGKSAFYHQAEMELAQAYAYTAQIMVENMMEKDAEEGISAFMQKRPAQWHGVKIRKPFNLSGATLCQTIQNCLMTRFSVLSPTAEAVQANYPLTPLFQHGENII